MARSYPAIKTVAVYPGAVDTNIMYHWRKKYLTSDRLMRLTTTFLNKLYRRMGKDVFTPQEGARTTMWVATARAADVANGGYYVPYRLVLLDKRRRQRETTGWDQNCGPGPRG
jgi:NAD(P)-dependent dehydrogenase (short-subunit alcohol dehydrogenase family)